jgi:TRAP-type C4-dicarboxylate transport system permease small subunit
MIAAIGSVARVLSRLAFWSACASIVGIVILVNLDVIMRRLGSPIDFPFEVSNALAGILAGLALAETTLYRNHTRVESFVTKLPQNWSRIVRVFTRSIGIAVFFIIGWNALRMGIELLKAGQHSPVLHLPEFPFPCLLGAGCLVTCLVLLYELLQYFEKRKR